MSSPATTVVVFQVTTPLDREELALAELAELRTLGTETRPEASPQETTLLAYFADRPGLEDEIRQALGGLPGVRVERGTVAQVDWLARFRETFGPQSVGGFFIVPAWDTAQSLPGRIPLRVDPGRAFGTGTHETTRLCLTAIESLARSGPLGRVLDIGTGSGILAIACCLLGATAVSAIDHDPEAVASARLHAHLNGVAFGLLQGDAGQPFRAGSFDLVLANLQAPLLLARRDELLSLCAPRGRLILSGLLEADRQALHAAYSAAGAVSFRRDGEWLAVAVEPHGARG